MRWLAAGVLVVAAWCAAGPAVAQSAPDVNQQQRQQFDLRQQELQRIAPPGGSVRLNGAAPVIPPGGACFTISRIAVAGADHLPPAALQAALAPFTGRCLALADIGHAIDTVNALYISRGYVTSRAYLPGEQNLSSGTLHIVAVEGALEGFRFEGRPADHHQQAAFPGLAGSTLNLRDLEQGLEQMNRLRTFDARMHVAPGDRPGSSLVIIEAAGTPAVYGKLYVDNTNTPVTGRWTGDVALNVDDPLGLLDAWGVEYDHNALPIPGTRESNFALVNLSIPHGYWTLYGSYQYSDYRYPVVGTGTVFQLTGAVQRFNLGLDRVLARDQLSKTSLEFGYQLERVQSDLDHVTLVTGTENLASLSARLSYTRHIHGGDWYATLGLAEGLPGAGTAQTLAVSSSYVPHAVYTKPSLDVNGYAPFTLFGQALEWEPSLHAEYSDDTEYEVDRLQIGGVYTVRGFLATSFAGDHGAYLHNDVVFNLAALALPRGLVSQSALYAGLDAGWAEDDKVEAGT